VFENVVKLFVVGAKDEVGVINELVEREYGVVSERKRR